MFKEAYHHSIFKDYFHVLNRIEILNILDKELQEEEKFIIKSQEDLQVFWENEYLDKFVRTDWDWSPEKSRNLDIRIPNEKWLEALSQSNFFLATPGIRMPMCHNIVEAMSMGTIPILQYADHFEPNLEHMKNCIIFEDEEDLVEKVRLVLHMSEIQIEELKQNVLNFFDTYYAPKGFLKIIEDVEDDYFVLYLYAEQASINLYKNS